jgi:signal transduction histidine kinase
MKSADHFNIGPRLTLAFALLIALILAGNALVIWQFQLARIQTDRLTGANQQLIAVLQLQVGLLSFHQRLDDLARSHDAHHLTTEAEPLRRVIEEQARQTRTAVANLAPGTQVDPAFLATLDTIEVALPAQLEAINDLAKSGDWATVQRRLDTELKPIETQTSVLVGSIQQKAKGELAQAALKMGTIQRRILFIVPITAISTFFIAAFFGWAVTRRIVQLRLEERLSERTRIARDLHDTFFQGIQGLLLRFHTATSQLHKDEPARRIFEEILKQSDQVMLEGRELVLDLRATASEQTDLATAFADFGDEMRMGSPCSFRVVVNGSIRSLHPVVFEELFKIGKEALGNAFRHSGAGSIEAELNYKRSELRVLIRDDGTGIDAAILQQGQREGHFGLRGMRERAKKLGAQLDVWSRPRAGTEVELRIAAGVAYVSGPNGSWLWKPRGLWHSAKQGSGPNDKGGAHG